MLTSIQSLPVIQVPLLQQYDWLVHGFGLKDVTMEQYADAFGCAGAVIPQTAQIHGKKVHVVGKGGSGGFPGKLDGDALVTAAPRYVCWVRSADCLPLLLVDPVHRAVGAIHAGWRGTAQKVVLETIQTMQREWKSDPADLKAALGPCIGGRSYRVGSDVAAAFREAGLYPGPWLEEIDRDHWYLDIAFANLHLLQTAGVPRESIYLSLACTASDTGRFHSFRAERGKKGKQVSFVMIR